MTIAHRIRTMLRHGCATLAAANVFVSALSSAQPIDPLDVPIAGFDAKDITFHDVVRQISSGIQIGAGDINPNLPRHREHKSPIFSIETVGRTAREILDEAVLNDPYYGYVDRGNGSIWVAPRFLIDDPQSELYIKVSYDSEGPISFREAKGAVHALANMHTTYLKMTGTIEAGMRMKGAPIFDPSIEINAVDVPLIDLFCSVYELSGKSHSWSWGKFYTEGRRDPQFAKFECLDKANKLRYPDHTREEIVAAYQNAIAIIPYPDLRIKAEMDLALRYPEWDDWYGALAIYESLLPGMAGRQDISDMNYWIIRRYAEACRHLGRHHDALRLLHEVYADDSPMCPVYNRPAIAKLIIEHAEYSDNVDIRYQQLVDLRGFYLDDAEFQQKLEDRISDVAVSIEYRRLKAERKTGQ